jgi:hypothetical protein
MPGWHAVGKGVNGNAATQAVGCAERATTGAEAIARPALEHAAFSGAADLADLPTQLICSGK